MGVDRKYQKKGLGKLLTYTAIKVTEDISCKIGCRLLIVDSFKKRVSFYEKIGFVLMEDQDSSRSTFKMIFDLA